MQNACMRHVDGSGGSGGHRRTTPIHPTIRLLLCGLTMIDLITSRSFAILTLVHFLLLFMWHWRRFLWRYLSSRCQSHLTIHCQPNWLKDWLLATVLHRNNIRGYFFSGSLSACLCLFLIYLYSITINNMLHGIWMQLSWFICLDFLCIWILTTEGKSRRE